MAACYKDGVILGADSRTSTGAYVANRVTNKLTKLTDHIYVCRSGSAADTQVGHHALFSLRDSCSSEEHWTCALAKSIY